VVHGVSGPLVGWLVERFGPRAVIVTEGLVLAGSLLLAAHGWRGALRILAVLVVAWIVPATLFLVRGAPAPPPPAPQAAPASGSSRRYWTLQTVART
jgi:hypothetical protein